MIDTALNVHVHPDFAQGGSGLEAGRAGKK
jgi:mannose-6-phosphate isomerase class I